MNETLKKALRDRRFECQRCGYCCSQKVLLYPSLEEVRNLSEYFGISESAFSLRYLQEVYDPQRNAYGTAFKTNQPGNPMTGCIFCQDKICVIYDSPRTELCHVFPWNHFDLERGEWEEKFISQKGTFWCPGIGKGRLWTREEIRYIKESFPNVGSHTKRQYHPPPPSGPLDRDVPRPSPVILTMSEEQLLHKWRSLSMEKRREVETLIDHFYHRGHGFHLLRRG